jgi:uncharacterized metal-binding protein
MNQAKELKMSTKSKDFTLQIDGVKGVCPAGEVWAEDKIHQHKIPVLSCEGPCIRGDIARLAANKIAKEDPFARACYAETFLVPHSSMTRWVKEADKVIMIDGCFLNCLGRALNNFVDNEKIVHFDALKIYKKYTDLFDMEDVPEAERIETAEQVADKILVRLRDIVASEMNDNNGNLHEAGEEA